MNQKLLSQVKVAMERFLTKSTLTILGGNLIINFGISDRKIESTDLANLKCKHSYSKNTLTLFNPSQKDLEHILDMIAEKRTKNHPL